MSPQQPLHTGYRRRDARWSVLVSTDGSSSWATGRATPVGDPWPARMARWSGMAAIEGVASP